MQPLWLYSSLFSYHLSMPTNSPLHIHIDIMNYLCKTSIFELDYCESCIVGSCVYHELAQSWLCILVFKRPKVNSLSCVKQSYCNNAREHERSIIVYFLSSPYDNCLNVKSIYLCLKNYLQLSLLMDKTLAVAR